MPCTPDSELQEKGVFAVPVEEETARAVIMNMPGMAGGPQPA